MSDNAPLYKELHAPGYFASGAYSAPRPPAPLKEETGIDDEWQIPTHREPQSRTSPPTIRDLVPTIIATPLPPSNLSVYDQSQLPAYHSNNPYQPREQRQRLPGSAPPRAAAAAAASDPFQNTSTSPPPNMTGATTTRDIQTRSDPAGQDSQEAAQDLEHALAGIQVTTPQEQEYENRWRRFGHQKDKDGNARQGRGANERDRGGENSRTGAGAGAGAGAFI